MVSNDGNDDLKFGEVSVSCGCTKPVLPVRSLAPKESTSLDVGFQISSIPQSVAHVITIPTNDPQKPLLKFTLFAESWPGAVAVPQSLNFGRLLPGRAHTEYVHVRSNDEMTLKINDLMSDSKQIALSSENPGASLRVHRIRVDFRPGKEAGAIAGTVRIVTDRPDAPVVAVPFVAEIAGPVTVMPPSLRIDRDAIGQVVESHLLIKSTSEDRDVVIKNLSVSQPWELIGYRIRPLKKGTLMLEVSTRFPEGDGTSSGCLSLTIDDEECPSYLVPLTITGWTPPMPEPPAHG